MTRYFTITLYFDQKWVPCQGSPKHIFPVESAFLCIFAHFSRGPAPLKEYFYECSILWGSPLKFSSLVNDSSHAVFVTFGKPDPNPLMSTHQADFVRPPLEGDTKSEREARSQDMRSRPGHG